MHKCGVTAGAWAIVHASRKPRVNAANDGYKPVKTVNIINGDVYNMDNVYFLAWCFNGVFGVSYTKFKTIEDLNVWKDKYNVKINAIHEYRNNHLYSIIFEDERGESERIKVENKKREKEIEEERRRKLRQHLYIDFVNGHKYF